ncbi:MAG: hypothetical protein AVDCRST_MAG42-1801 [uncultured Chthoniobacterales bacterium]|uniref:Lipoprotein n=1 Tax=uncultured Chthoniobacterales bacterium TaxID=1836801 RepID=A0A6J4HW76_9BACT|nr:MAG: hypothetical protein AVDCRST_MAG42-1801 [uncultured Chthoniobacterales bacterium]
MLSKTLSLLAGAAAVILVAAACRDEGRGASKDQQRQPAGPAAGTVQSSGRILGVAIGDTLESTREQLDPLRAPGSYPPDEKELQGRRIYWKLAGTDYDWIMAWADKQGKVTRVRAMFRAEHQKPFAEIGDLAAAITADAQTVRWNLKTESGAPYRLVAQGTDQKAISVYMFSQAVGSTDHQAVEPDLSEK